MDIMTPLGANEEVALSVFTYGSVPFGFVFIARLVEVVLVDTWNVFGVVKAVVDITLES